MGLFEGILLCSDLDGTLTNQTTLSAENARAIRAFQNEGGQFVIATGRCPSYLERYRAQMLPSAYMICANGTMIYNRDLGKVIKSWTLSLENIELIRNQIVSNLHPATCYAVGGDLEVHFVDIATVDFSKIPQPIYKVVLTFTSPEATKAATERLQKNMDGHMQCVQTWPEGTEFLPMGSGKGACLSYLREMLGDTIKMTVAVGDYNNDVSMLQTADLSYGVQGGAPAVLQVCDCMAPAVEHHAIAYIISELEEKQRAKRI